MTAPILEVTDLVMHFPIHAGIFQRTVATVRAVDGVSFAIPAGKTLGLVGESGCGKSTVARTIARLYRPTSGHIVFAGNDIGTKSQGALRPIRRQLQMVFQDPVDSLNARHTVGTILAEPFRVHKIGNAQSRVREVRGLLDRVGLPQGAENRFPHEFSGGQRQRIGIARAIALKPQLVICDEPVSALDVSVQAQVLNLLLDLQHDLGLAYLFIAHDLAVVKHMSDQIAVMYLGRIVELAAAETLLAHPLHPYTQALIAAIPDIEQKRASSRRTLHGEVPSPVKPPSGCPFHPRCPMAQDICRRDVPPLRTIPSPDGMQRMIACHLV